jgi:hypothetical protein
MFQIGNVLVSLDLIEKNFTCDISKCKGICCVEGDAGAPLEKFEVNFIEDNFALISSYMQPEGLKSIKEQGFAVYDEVGDLVTPLIDNKECAYCFFDKGIAKCAIEKAFLNNGISFRKPISCWLYPVRVSAYNSIIALSVHQWPICIHAFAKGEKDHVPVYQFVKQPLIARFGEDWYNNLEKVALEWQKQINSANHLL